MKQQISGEDIGNMHEVLAWQVSSGDHKSSDIDMLAAHGWTLQSQAGKNNAKI